MKKIFDQEIEKQETKLGKLRENLEKNNTRLAFVKWDDKTKTGEYVRFPERSELNAEVNELLIVEYYNR